MTIIKGYADLFLKQVIGKMTEKQEVYMKKIFQSTESLIELVNNILDISKIEAGRIEIILADVNVHSAITKCVDDFQDMFAEKKVALLLTDSIDFDIIKTDESKFRLVLSNLLSNAYKFTPVGGKVEVKAWNDEKYLHVRVYRERYPERSDRTRIR
jgi:signal transduction histidine kinase